MECVDKRELKQFLQGELEPERLVAVDEHVSSCSACKALLEGMPSRARTLASFGADLAGAGDCPDYEELSALVDETLDSNRARAVKAHANMCELCARDLDHIGELQSHAALGKTIRVQPGMTRREEQRPFGLWKRVVAAAAVVGVITVAAVALRQPPPASTKTQVAVTKPTGPKPTHIGPGPRKLPVVVINPDHEKPAPPRPKALLRDGRYQLVGKDGGFALARVDGRSIRTPFEARIAALIEEKIRTGKIKPAESVRVAMKTIRLRSRRDESYVPPPTAPKQVSPVGVVIATDSPEFVWSSVDLAESYRLVIMDSKGNTLTDEITEKTALKPSRPLERGRVYLWRVGTRFSMNDEWANSRAGGFKVISARDTATIQQVTRRMPGSHLALAAVYESVGLYDDAAREYRALRRANPASQLARRLTAR